MKQLYNVSKNKRRRIMAGAVLTAAVLLALAGITIARYVMHKANSGTVEAQNFYFTSDLMKDGTESSGQDNFIDSQEELRITLYNYADSKRYTASEIKGTVTVEGGTVKSGSPFTLAGKKKSEQTIIIAPDAGAAEVKVTAETSSPYVKTLSAEFKAASGNQYYIEDTNGNRGALLTIIYTDKSLNKVRITLPGDVTLDNADSKIQKENDVYVFTPDEQGVYSLILLKSDISRDLSAENTAFGTDIVLN